MKNKLEETHRALAIAGTQVCEMLCSRRFSKARANYAAGLAEDAAAKLRALANG